jgi:hypothetical protein
MLQTRLEGEKRLEGVTQWDPLPEAQLTQVVLPSVNPMAQLAIHHPAATQWVDPPPEVQRAQVVPNDNRMGQRAIHMTKTHQKNHPAIDFVLL